MNSKTTFMRGFALSPGAHALPQTDLAEILHEKLKDLDDPDEVCQLVRFVHERSGIHQRYFEIHPDEAAKRKDWVKMVSQATLSIVERSLEKLFSSDLHAQDCDALIIASSSFNGFPSMSRIVQQRFGFPADVLCYDLTGLGCAGPTHAIYLATMLINTHGCRNVCVVCAEAMATQSAARHHANAPSFEQLVAHCLPSDGGGAMLLGVESSDEALLRFETASLRTRQWENTIDQNDFGADEENQPFMAVGKDIRNQIGGELGKLFTEQNLEEPIILHPGGRALMERVAQDYPVLEKVTGRSCDVLIKHGNVGSASLMFVFNEALLQGASLAPRLQFFALAPGIVSTLLCLENVVAERKELQFIDRALAS